MSELSSRYVHREITLLCLWHSNTCQHTNHISRICLTTAMRNSPRRRRKHRPHRPLWVLLYHSPIYQSVWCRVHAMAATWLHFHVAKIEKGFTARCFVRLFPVLNIFWSAALTPTLADSRPHQRCACTCAFGAEAARESGQLR